MILLTPLFPHAKDFGNAHHSLFWTQLGLEKAHAQGVAAEVEVLSSQLNEMQENVAEVWRNHSVYELFFVALSVCNEEIYIIAYF